MTLAGLRLGVAFCFGCLLGSRVNSQNSVLGYAIVLVQRDCNGICLLRVQSPAPGWVQVVMTGLVPQLDILVVARFTVDSSHLGVRQAT